MLIASYAVSRIRVLASVGRDPKGLICTKAAMSVSGIVLLAQPLFAAVAPAQPCAKSRCEIFAASEVWARSKN